MVSFLFHEFRNWLTISVTLLSTRTNNLVTVYDVTRSGDLIQVLDEPRDLVLGENTYDHHLGFAPVEQLRGLLSLSTQGALTFTGVGIPSSDPPIIEVHGSKELDELKEQEAVLNAKPDPLDEIDTSHLNMEKLRKGLILGLTKRLLTTGQNYIIHASTPGKRWKKSKRKQSTM